MPCMSGQWLRERIALNSTENWFAGELFVELKKKILFLDAAVA